MKLKKGSVLKEGCACFVIIMSNSAPNQPFHYVFPEWAGLARVLYRVTKWA